jgi:membrane-associated phospholipid phosphatase
MPGRPWLPVAGIAYIAILAGFGELHGGNVLLGLLGLLDAYNERTRRFLRTFLPFILTGVIYDSLRFFLQAAIAGRIHVSGPYLLERAWFGIGGHTIDELFAAHHWVVLDLVTCLAYLFYVAEYLALAMFLFARGQTGYARSFGRGFLVVNLLGFFTFLAYPVAPPWYVAAHGLGPAHANAVASAAAAARFDALIQLHLFADMYGHSVIVFGAMPSLHVAYPALAAMLAFEQPILRRARKPAIAYAVIVAFSAVYLQHHYVIDVLLGVVYAAIAAVIVRAWDRRSRGVP